MEQRKKNSVDCNENRRKTEFNNLPVLVIAGRRWVADVGGVADWWRRDRGRNPVRRMGAAEVGGAAWIKSEVRVFLEENFQIEILEASSSICSANCSETKYISSFRGCKLF